MRPRTELDEMEKNLRKEENVSERNDEEEAKEWRGWLQPRMLLFFLFFWLFYV